MKVVKQKCSPSLNEVREYRRVKVAVCRANKIRVVKDLQDGINSYRAKLGLPPKDFSKKSSGTRKGKPRPNYEPPLEMRAHMTKEEISAWKVAERKKRRNIKARAEKEKEDEMVRDLRMELKQLRQQVGELSEETMDMYSNSAVADKAGEMNCDKAGKKIKSMDQEKQMAIGCKADCTKPTSSRSVHDNESKAAATKPKHEPDDLLHVSECPILMLSDKKSIITRETNKEVNMNGGSCAPTHVSLAHEGTSFGFENVHACSTETDLMCLTNDDSYAIDFVNLHGNYPTGVTDRVTHSSAPMPCHSSEKWNIPVHGKIDFEGIENIIEPSDNVSNFECDDLSVISCIDFNPTDDLVSSKKLAVNGMSKIPNLSITMNDQALATKVSMETDRNAFALSGDSNSLIPDPAYGNWCNDILDLLDADVNNDTKKEEFIFGRVIDNIVASQDNDPLFERPLTGIDVEIQALACS